MSAKLDPYLGYLHSVQHGKPSLVCDLMEPYRYLADDFAIQFCQSLHKKDFITKEEPISRNKIGRREYLNDAKTKEMMAQLSEYFEKTVEIPRIRHGNRQTIETLINEEVLLFAKYLRNEKETWTPRIAIY